MSGRTEAKKRNPAITLYGLPWAWPAWIGGGTNNPYHNISLPATYILNWVKGAKSVYGLDIDYVGGLHRATHCEIR
jgi:galactosylceramidase